MGCFHWLKIISLSLTLTSKRKLFSAPNSDINVKTLDISLTKFSCHSWNLWTEIHMLYTLKAKYCINILFVLIYIIVSPDHWFTEFEVFRFHNVEKQERMWCSVWPQVHALILLCILPSSVQSGSCCSVILSIILILRIGTVQNI